MTLSEASAGIRTLPGYKSAALCTISVKVDAFVAFLGLLSEDIGAHLWAEDIQDAADWHAEVVS